MLEALMFGHEAVKELCAIQEDIISEIGLEKIEVVLANIPEELREEVNNDIKEDMVAAIQIKDKLEKYARIDAVKEEAQVHFAEVYSEDDTSQTNTGDRDIHRIFGALYGRRARG